MAILNPFMAFLAFASISFALPLINNIDQLQEWQTSVEEYVNTVPQKQIEQYNRIIESANAPQACEDIFLIFARGTFEPSVTDNLGVMVGMPFISALKLALRGKSIGSSGVDYNNGVVGYLTGGDGTGGKTMAKMIQDKAAKCPQTKIIASGYR
jgi:hypothetical protein